MITELLFSFKKQNNRKQFSCYKFRLNLLKINFYYFIFLIYETYRFRKLMDRMFIVHGK